MKKLLTVLIFVFLSATVAAHEFSLNLGYDEIYQMAKSPANQSGASHFLVPAPTKTVTRSNTEALLIAANSGDSRNQQKQSDVYKPGRNHDRKAKSKYDLRDIDGKRGGDGDKHVHKHDSHDNKPKSKYDLREIGGHKHGEGHHHGHGEAHHHDHGHDHHHDGEAHHHEHGDDHHHHHGEAHHHDHEDDHDHHAETEGHDHDHAGHDQGGHDHGHDHGHEHGGWEPPEGLYDRLWDVVTLG